MNVHRNETNRGSRIMKYKHIFVKGIMLLYFVYQVHVLSWLEAYKPAARHLSPWFFLHSKMWNLKLWKMHCSVSIICWKCCIVLPVTYIYFQKTGEHFRGCQWQLLLILILKGRCVTRADPMHAYISKFIYDSFLPHIRNMHARTISVRTWHN